MTHKAALPPLFPKNDSTIQRHDIMKIPENGKLLRVFIGESDRWQHQPLYEAIVLKARELGLAGATVLRGPMGFGANSHLHTAKILRLSMDLPMIIEIVDTEEKISLLLPHLDDMVQEGLVTLEDVRVLKYRANQDKPRS
jgi:PII-like signaling protein